MVDFPDDALTAPHPASAAQIDCLMATLADRGIKRVSWTYYGDDRGGYHMPAGIERMHPDTPLDFDQNQWANFAATHRQLGNPLRVAVDAAHRHGLEIYAYFKPYETGISIVLPEGSPQAERFGLLPHIGGQLAWLDPFVVEHPELRIRRRTDDIPQDVNTARIGSIALTKSDDGPTRITADHLQIWTSEDNYQYTQRDIEFTCDERVEPSPAAVYDVYGNLVTEAGAPVRVLTLSGLDLDARFVLVTTDFTEGEPDFGNAWHRLMTVYDLDGRELPGVFATGTEIWFSRWENFRTGGLTFDTGRGPEVIALDRPNACAAASGTTSSRHHLFDRPVGYIAYTRGRNAYLPGALCETEPRVREFWLACIASMLDAGVDGIEVRVENHSCHTDTPDDYGYNDVILSQLPDGIPPARSEVARVRGEAYTAFLWDAAALTRAQGKTMRVTLNVDWFRETADDRPGSRKLAYPANIDFQWQRWIDEGLLDAAVLRPFAKPFDGIFQSDPVAQDMIRRCQKAAIPITVNRYVWGNEGLIDEYRKVRDDSRFAGFILYEVWSYMSLNDDDAWEFATPPDGSRGSDVDGSIDAIRAATANRVLQVIREHGGNA